MAFDKVVDSAVLDAKLTALADIIRRKNESTKQMDGLDGIAEELEKIRPGYSEKKMEAIASRTEELVLDEGLTSIKAESFRFRTDITLSELPSGLTSIGNNAFYLCSSITLRELPSGVTSIGNNAFEGCYGLKQITFKGTPETIASSAFVSCENLKTINVPWAEGEVAGAPWGARRATINYNYTGEA